MHQPPPRRARPEPLPSLGLRRAGLALLLLAATGCQGGSGILRRWSMQGDAGVAGPITSDELDDNRNLVAKWLNPQKGAQGAGAYSATLALGSGKADPETDKEITSAIDLFQQGRLPEAEKALAALEKKKSKAAIKLDDQGLETKDDGGKKDLWSRVKGAPVFAKAKKLEPAWGERVLYYLGECQYQQGKFVAANDTFEKLLNQYPGGPHREKAVAREFAIAEAWFAAGEDQAKENAKADAKTADGAPRDDGVRQAEWADHFNGRMPLIDVDGYALKAMEHVRQHDATGPLADRATLRIADHYMKKADYENASAHYDELLTSYAKSPLVEQAQLGSIEAKLKGYMGPQYDGEGLEKAKVLIKQTLTAFPNKPPEVRDKLYHDLDLIADQQAERDFLTGEFYKTTGFPGGAEFYFGKVQARWPKSAWAEKAKVEMATLAKAPRKKITPSKILTLPGAPDPNAMGNSMGSMATMPGGGMGGGQGMSGP